MSVNSFLRLFRAETGETPQNWSRQKRLENACRLLQFSSETVERIAELSGFCDRYHFSRVFKSKYGSGPAGHRRRARMLMEGGELRAGALEKESPRV
jgi:transcriptional regulator GlxA family with amidase domain